MNESTLKNNPELRTHRLLLMIAAVAITMFGFSIKCLSPGDANPMIQRYFLSGICLVILMLSYKSRFIRSELSNIIQIILYCVTFNIFLSAFFNEFAIEYLVEIMVIMLATVSIGFTRKKWLLSYLVFVFTCCSVALYASDQLAFSAEFMLIAFGFICCTVYFIMSSKLDIQRDLKESEAGWRSFLQNAQDIIICIDTAHRISYVNNMFWLKPEEIIGTNVYRHIPKKDRERLQAIYSAVLEGGETASYQISYKMPSGKREYYSSIVNPVKNDGRIVGATIIARNITGSTIAEERLKQSYELLRNFTKALDSTMGMTKIGLDGNITHANKKFCEFTGFTAEELIGNNFELLRVAEFNIPEFFEGIWNTIASGKVWQGEIKGRMKNGMAFWHDVSIIPVTGKDGKVEEYVSLVYSITDHRELQEALNQARLKAEEVAQAKSNFLAVMSHEIRTPMNAVIGMTGLLLDTQLTEEQRDYAETIKFGGNSLLDVINEILDYSKIEAGKFELEEQEFDLLQSIEDVLDLTSVQATNKGLELMYEIETDVPRIVKCDASRLRQVLVNLVNNAIKFTDKGEIVVSVDRESDIPGYKMIRFAVRDSGIGIPSDKMHLLFQSFSQVDSSSTRKYGGSGLGLSICKKIVNFMGGNIWVESKKGTGSVFYFTVRVKEMKGRTVLSSNNSLFGNKVLIVDDNATNLKILATQCRRWGMDVVAIQDSLEAFKMVQDKNQRFNLAILDMQMPGMDGARLTGELRKIYNKKELPIIILSSLGQPAKAEDKDLYTAFLSKPIKHSQLFRVIKDALTSDIKNMSENRSGIEIPKKPRSAQPLRICLAEDNAVNQKVALRMLEKLGYKADVTGNGIEILAALNFKQYDLILMDVQMPEMDGLAATQQIKKKYNGSSPVIIGMTAGALEEDKAECLAAGMDDYISKPVDIDTLEVLIKKWSGRQKVA